MQRKTWRLLYTVRARQRAAYYAQLLALGADRIEFHFDEEKQGFADVTRYLDGLTPSEHVYCYGPEALMQAVENTASAHPGHALHFERFSAPGANMPSQELADSAFLVRLRRSGRALSVESGKSILETLEEAGATLPFSCREDLCRSCETSVCSGEPDHLDYVLSDEERSANSTMMICVSRSKSPMLELDN